jgi:uncharacterized OB-fold protein
VKDYPQPRETPDNAPMLAAWRTEGALQLQRCGRCGTAIFYPRAICPHCRSLDLTWFRSSGLGRVVSFSLVHRGLPACFLDEVPIVLAEIQLEDGVPMIARIITDQPHSVHSGMLVELVAAPKASLYSLPTFQPRRLSATP